MGVNSGERQSWEVGMGSWESGGGEMGLATRSGLP